MFEKEKYLSYVASLKAIIILEIFVAAIITILTFILTHKIFTTIFVGLVSYAFVQFNTFGLKIKIQEMNLKIDIYNHIIKED